MGCVEVQVMSALKPVQSVLLSTGERLSVTPANTDRRQLTHATHHYYYHNTVILLHLQILPDIMLFYFQLNLLKRFAKNVIY